MNKNMLFSATPCLRAHRKRFYRCTWYSKINFKKRCQVSELHINFIVHTTVSLWTPRSTQTHFRPNAAGKKPFKTKKKKMVTRGVLGHFRWAPFFLYCQQIKSFRPTAQTLTCILVIVFN